VVEICAIFAHLPFQLRAGNKGVLMERISPAVVTVCRVDAGRLYLIAR